MSLNSTITALGNSIINLVNNKVASAGVYFENVAALKVATNLSSGQIVATKGYYTVNDGGGAEYYIRQKTQSDVDDGGSIIFITDTDLCAELLVRDGIINVKQFGCIADANYRDSETGLWYTASNKQTRATNNYTQLNKAVIFADKTGKFLKFEGKF